VTDQEGKRVEYAYDDANQLKSVVQMDHPDAAHNTTNYAYDGRGNLTGSTDANEHTTATGFDLLNRQTSRTLPAGGPSETRTYDAAGNLLTLTGYNGKTTTYSYDALNRLLSKTPDPSLGERR
jgi:RHS Repeat.